jgi:serine/threonine protein kinase
MAQIQPKVSKTIKLINQGTFGCVFRPGLKCGSKMADSDNYITKVQVDKSEVLIEINIGKIVMAIPNYQYRFAPIIETCPIDISTIGATEIKKCDVIVEANKNKPNSKFVSNKIKYVGKLSLGDYLDNLLIKNDKHAIKSVENYFKKIIDINIYLLQSVQLLVNNSIIHYDLKENNIMFDTSNDIPVIIDFGLSFQINKLTESNYADAFYTLYAQYTCWCAEIMILCYIIKRIYKEKTESIKSLIKKAAIDDMKKQVIIYLTENEALKHYISENEKNIFKLKLYSFLNSFHEKTWKQLMDALIATHKTWDSYSVAVILIREISHSGIYNQQSDSVFLKGYMGILKNLILAPPSKREEISVTLDSIKSIFSKVNKSEYTSFKKTASVNLNKPNQIKQRRAENTLSELMQDDELKKRR